MTYPVIKIPSLINKIKLQKVTKQFTRKKITNIDKKKEAYITILKYPKAAKTTFAISGTFFMFSAWIFIAAVIYNIQWLNYSLLSLLCGIVGVNISSLIAENKILVSDSDLVIKPIEVLTQSTEVFTQSEFIPIDWHSILKNNIMPHGKVATAQVGVSEPYFENFLNKYFKGVIYPGYEFKINLDNSKALVYYH